MIAQEYGLPKSSVHRHKQNHLPTFKNAERAAQVMEITAGLAKILDSRDGMRLSGYGDADRPLERLLGLTVTTAIDDPVDRLRRATIQAVIRLAAIRYRGPDFWGHPSEQDATDYLAAIEALQSWRHP